MVDANRGGGESFRARSRLRSHMLRRDLVRVVRSSLGPRVGGRGPCIGTALCPLACGPRACGPSRRCRAGARLRLDRLADLGGIGSGARGSAVIDATNGKLLVATTNNENN